MANAAVPAFYSWVIGDVVEKMARKFAEMGVDEHVLTELQQNWEERIRSARVAPFALPAAEQARGYAFKNVFWLNLGCTAAA